MPNRAVSVDEQTYTVASPAPKHDAAILRKKCKEIRAQIDSFNAENFHLLPENEEVRFHVLKENYSRYLEQLEDCYGFIQYTKTEISNDIKREEKTRVELQSLISAAEAKLGESREEEQSKKNVYKRLEAKCAALEKKNNDIGRKMTMFLGKHFPVPTHEAFMKVKKKVEMEARSEADLLPLNDIVQELMNLSVDSPNDPYLLLNHRHWPPYIELLLQCDIALRHPTDCQRIKLMPFQL